VIGKDIVLIAKSFSKNNLTVLFIRTLGFKWSRYKVLSLIFSNFISILREEAFLTRIISVCIHIFTTGELSQSPLSWLHEKRPRRLLRI
jgi:hypothetical protein